MSNAQSKATKLPSRLEPACLNEADAQMAGLMKKAASLAETDGCAAIDMLWSNKAYTVNGLDDRKTAALASVDCLILGINALNTAIRRDTIFLENNAANQERHAPLLDWLRAEGLEAKKFITGLAESERPLSPVAGG